MINSTLEWIHVQGISPISLSAIIFEAVPFSSSLPEAGTRRRKKRVEMGYKRTWACVAQEYYFLANSFEYSP